MDSKKINLRFISFYSVCTLNIKIVIFETVLSVKIRQFLEGEQNQIIMGDAKNSLELISNNVITRQIIRRCK